MAEKYHLAQQVGWLFPRYRALCGKKYWPTDADLGAPRGAKLCPKCERAMRCKAR